MTSVLCYAVERVKKGLQQNEASVQSESKSYVSVIYSAFNVLLQSALHPGIKNTFAASQALRQNDIPLHPAQIQFVWLTCCAACPLLWSMHVQQPCYSEEAKSNKTETDPSLLT